MLNKFPPIDVQQYAAISIASELAVPVFDPIKPIFIIKSKYYKNGLTIAY